MLSDLRFSLRMLRKNLVFLVAAVLSLALGIGAATTVFSAFRAVFLRPLPYADPDHLVQITRSEADQRTGALTVADFQFLRKFSHSFDHFGSYGFLRALTFRGAGEPANLVARIVENDFFPALGTRPILGRVFANNDFIPGNPRGVILAFSVWQKQFQADPGVVGRQVMLDGESYSVIGVMAADFHFPSSFTTLWIPDRDQIKNPLQEYRDVVARLKPGIPVSAARAELERLRPAIVSPYPVSERKFRLNVESLSERDTAKYKTAFWMLCCAVGLLVVIACLNVANLVIARSVGREGEFALRSALGAARKRLVMQVLLESSVLALMGGILGIVFAFVANRVLVAWLPASHSVPRLGETRVDLAVLAFALGTTTVTALLFGMGPALLLSRFNLREMGRTATENRRRIGWRQGLVISEIALSLTLLIGAGLLMRSFLALSKVDPGFRADHLLTVMVPASAQLSKDKPALVRRLAEITALAERLPGVTAAGLASAIPMGMVNVSITFSLPEHPREEVGATYRAVSLAYFQAIGTPLRLGRLFTSHDDAAGPPVALVNETFARKYWPGRNPIGQKLTGPVDITIVGVVADTHSHALSGPAEPELFRPYQQYLGPAIGAMLVVRTRDNPLNLAASLRQSIHRRYPDQPVTDVQTMEMRVAGSMGEPRLYTWLLGMFAGVALLLTAVGVHGVISYSVGYRTREFGIRMALGAQHSDVLLYVLRNGATLIFTGAFTGFASAWVLSRYLRSLLFSMGPRDPLTFAAASLLLMGIALIACYLPARRATNIDPQIALRQE